MFIFFSSHNKPCINCTFPVDQTLFDIGYVFGLLGLAAILILILMGIREQRQ